MGRGEKEDQQFAARHIMYACFGMIVLTKLAPLSSHHLQTYESTSLSPTARFQNAGS